MPHWVEVTLPKPVDVVRVELVNRAGPYQITDFEIEAYEGQAWKRLQAVQGASGRELGVPLTPPVRVDKLRVKILKELYQGQDRQYADLAALRVLDASGRDWVAGRAARIPLRFEEPEVGRLFGEVAVPSPPGRGQAEGAAVSWPPMAIGVEVTTAKVVATLQAKHPAVAMLANRFGSGEAHLVTTGDGAFDAEHAFWHGLARLASGEPTLIVSPDVARRYRTILTRVGGAHVLHVIDSQADSAGGSATPVSISLLPARLGGLHDAIQVGNDKPLPLSPQGDRISLVVLPDPVASVVLK
jgi:hypothetical protein